MTTTNLILSIILFFSAVAIFMLTKKIKKAQIENKMLTAKNDEFRGYLSTMNNELDSKDAELMELAQDPNSIVGVKYRTQAEIRRNRQQLALRMEEEK